jgi:acetyl-CoA carboxylase/biotin carboxylase 1
MSQGTVMVQPKQEKDFTVGTPEEFVRRFGGTKVINKVRKLCSCNAQFGSL